MTEEPVQCCWACRSDLALNQRFCTNCSKWQDVRRHLSLPPAILSSLVALVSVSGVFIPIIAETFRHDPSPYVEIGGIYQDDWRSFTLFIDNLAEKEVLFPRFVSCYEFPLEDNAEYPPTYIYQASSSSFIRGLSSKEVNFVFSRTYNIKPRGEIQLTEESNIQCSGKFYRQNGYKVDFQMGDGVVGFFELSFDKRPYYPETINGGDSN